MNIILSLIVSLAMLFSGAAELPAVPETAMQYTLSEVTLTVDGESVTLNPAAVLTAALGSEQVDLAFEVHSGEDVLLPLAGRLSADGAVFSLADSGKAFTVSAATLEEMLGITADPQTEEILQVVEEMIAAISGLNSAEIDPALNQTLIDNWAASSGAEIENVEVEVDGETIAAQRVMLNLGLKDIVSSYDVLLNSENEAASGLIQSLLKVFNLAMGAEYTSFTELYDGLMALAAQQEGTEADAAVAEVEALTLPIELTVAYGDELVYEQAIVEMEQEGQGMTMDCVEIIRGGDGEMYMTMTAEGGDTDMSMVVTGSYDEAGNAYMNYDVASVNSYSYEMTDDAGQPYTFGSSEAMSMMLTLDVAVDEDGMKDSTVDLYIANTSSYEDKDEVEAYETSVSLFGQATEALEEDGSVTTDCYLSLDVADEAMPVSLELSFLLNSASVPYADAFEGDEMLELTADTESEAYQQIEAEALYLLSDVMTVASDESVMQLAALFEAEEDYEVYDEDESYDDYSVNSPATIEEAIVTYGGEVPTYTAPEGYVLDYIYVDEGYLSLDYSNEESYFSMSLSPSYYDESTVTRQLNTDGSLTEVDSVTVEISLNEDGTVSYASFVLDGTDISIFFDAVDMAAAETILAGFMG